MAKTREDYFQQGRDCAQRQEVSTEEVATPYARGGTSWQAQAFWVGYEAEKDRLAKVDHQRGGIHMDRMTANTRGWPPAAAEHARLLAARINSGAVGRMRLMASLHRLQKRWGAGSKRTINN